MTISEGTKNETKPIIATAEDIIRESVKVYPDLPHDKAVQQWLSENYPRCAEIFYKINEKYAERISIGDVALHYAVTEMIDKAFKYGEKGPPNITVRETALICIIMIFSFTEAIFLLAKGTLYGLIIFICVSGGIIAFFLALEKGLIGRKGNNAKTTILFK